MVKQKKRGIAVVVVDIEVFVERRKNVVMQAKGNKRRLTSKSNAQSESNTPKGVVRKMLKRQKPCKPKSRSSKKTAVECQDEDMETSASQDAGTPVQDGNRRASVGSVSSATKLKLAAFSASDVVRCCFMLF